MGGRLSDFLSQPRSGCCICFLDLVWLVGEDCFIQSRHSYREQNQPADSRRFTTMENCCVPILPCLVLSFLFFLMSKQAHLLFFFFMINIRQDPLFRAHASLFSPSCASRSFCILAFSILFGGDHPTGALCTKSVATYLNTK